VRDIVPIPWNAPGQRILGAPEGMGIVISGGTVPAFNLSFLALETMRPRSAGVTVLIAWNLIIPPLTVSPEHSDTGQVGVPPGWFSFRHSRRGVRGAGKSGSLFNEHEASFPNQIMPLALSAPASGRKAVTTCAQSAIMLDKATPSMAD
jgi:hypothetical protein